MRIVSTESQLKSIEAYLQESVAPRAEEIDRSEEALGTVLQRMGDRSLLALKVPQQLGGRGWDELNYRRFQVLMARYSGALTFLQTQHQSAASWLAKSDNLTLQQEYLPQMGNGKKLVGVGFSHLRRRGKPMVEASSVAAGYVLNGAIPWITGFGFFDSFIVGATLTDGSELYGMLPLEDAIQPLGGKLSFSKPMALIAISATNTVSGKLENWLLQRDRIVSIKPPGSIHRSSRRNILHHGFYALGCAYGSLDVLQAVGEKKQLSFLQESREYLLEKVQKCDRAMMAAVSDETITYQDKLQFRAQAIKLAARCSHGAVIATSGGANALNSAAGRVYREALLFSVSGQTTDVMEASIKNIL
ncbi:MAG: acyl-CoA dehydrogenase family protein [Pleurocapsa sp.]